jgi:hypothetical protein
MKGEVGGKRRVLHAGTQPHCPSTRTTSVPSSVPTTEWWSASTCAGWQCGGAAEQRTLQAAMARWLSVPSLVVGSKGWLVNWTSTLFAAGSGPGKVLVLHHGFCYSPPFFFPFSDSAMLIFTAGSGPGKVLSGVGLKCVLEECHWFKPNAGVESQLTHGRISTPPRLGCSPAPSSSHLQLASSHIPSLHHCRHSVGIPHQLTSHRCITAGIMFVSWCNR